MTRKHKRERMIKLSYKFTVIVLCSALLSGALFVFLFINRYHVFYSIVNENVLKKTTADAVDELQATITQNHISKSDENSIRNEMRKYRELTMQLYDEESAYYVDHLSPLESDVYVETSSFLLTLYYPEYESYTVKFYDGPLTMTVFSYRGVIIMEIYVVTLAAICVTLFLTIIMVFMHKKMKYVLYIEKEMKFIEGGDYLHAIVYKGNDELTSLARQLSVMRQVLYDNMRKEKEAREANHELVMDMSHDLRTPLTSLMGYLDILDMKIYKNDQEREEYIQKSKAKAQQIKEMSDKLFNHFLVYAQDEEFILRDVSSEEVNSYLEAQCGDLIEKGYQIQFHVDAMPYLIKGDMELLKRIFDNVLSNILKYADKDREVKIYLHVNDEHINIRIANKKKKDISKEESTRIGLKSVEKIISYMNGEFHFKDLEEDFFVELIFPTQIMKS